jgi:TetR/AcrR family fatty acid metabolism transcriptional regulator
MGVYRKDIIPGITKQAFFGALDEVSRIWSTPNTVQYSLEDTTEQVISLFLTGMRRSSLP